MKKSFLLFILLILCCCVAQKSIAQEYDTTDTSYLSTEEEQLTTSGKIPVLLKEITADSIIATIQKDKAFAYMAYLDSLLRAEEAAKKKEPPKLEYDESPSFWRLSWVKYMFWAIAIIAVGFILYKFVIGKGGLFTSNKKQELPKAVPEQEPTENAIDSLLLKAIQHKDYRLAVRYQFLKTLNDLGKKGVLQLSTDKTNYQYAYELQKKPYANTFARLSLQYEYVWFGNFTINQEQFGTIQQQHVQLLKEI